ncbi:MAG: arsenate reductase (glutaredoxin) [Deltaproteobacteria bacterium]|nr:arsenate reductase (glutaredoxin) [Deltaproteobacteria bacterium]MBI3295853.1 arsenate reductase (glutaredoxin) [Deltaproteobacteria bacterium]
MKIGSYGYTSGTTRQIDSNWTIYYNPLCSKCRETLDLLRMNLIDPEIIEYLESPLKKDELERVLLLLKLEAKDLVRAQEAVFATLKIDLNNQNEILAAIEQHPQLLVRPIVVHGTKAIIARPPERALELKD